MRTVVTCPHCQRSFQVEPVHLGRVAACRGCGQRFQLGQSPSPAPPDSRVDFGTLAALAPSRAAAAPPQGAGPAPRPTAAQPPPAESHEPWFNSLLHGDAAGAPVAAGSPRKARLTLPRPTLPTFSTASVRALPGRVSPLGLLLVVAAAIVGHLAERADELPPGIPEYVTDLPWVLGPGGIALLIAGALGLTAAPPDPFDRFIRVFSSTAAAALVTCLVLLQSDPAHAAAVRTACFAVLVIGGASAVGAGLWYIIATFGVSRGLGVLLLVVIFGGGALAARTGDPTLHLLRDVAYLGTVGLSLLLHLRALRQPATFQWCAVIVALSAGALIALSHAPPPDSPATPAAAPATTDTSAPTLPAPALADRVALSGLTIRPPAGWTTVELAADFAYWKSADGTAEMRVWCADLTSFERALQLPAKQVQQDPIVEDTVLVVGEHRARRVAREREFREPAASASVRWEAYLIELDGAVHRIHIDTSGRQRERFLTQARQALETIQASGPTPPPPTRTDGPPPQGAHPPVPPPRPSAPAPAPSAAPPVEPDPQPVADPATAAPQPTATAPPAALPAAPPAPRVSAALLQHLGPPVALDGGYRLRVPTELSGTLDAAGRSGQWRGTGQLQQHVGLNVSVKTRTARDAELADPLRMGPDGKPHSLRAHGRSIPVGTAAIDRFTVAGLTLVRCRIPDPPDARVSVAHYAAFDGDRCLAFTIRSAVDRPLQRDVLEAAVFTLQPPDP